jgi:DNA primase
MLTRYDASRLILVYDSDEAGIRSALRCIEIFWKEHVDFGRGDVFREEKADTHILVLPTGHDPDSYLMEKGVASFQQFASKLAAINDNVARSLYIKQLAEQIGIDEDVVLEKVRMHTSAKAKKDSVRRKDVANQGSRLEQQIIAMMLQFPAILPEIKKFHVIEYFENDSLKSIGKIILEKKLSSAEQISEVLTFVHDPVQENLITTLAMTEEPWDESGCVRLINQFVKTGQKYKDSKILEKIKAAEKKNDQETLDKLLRERQKLAMQSQKPKLT